MTSRNTFHSQLKHYKNIFRNQMKSTHKNNQITHEDFGLFQTELLQIDFLTFNLTKLSNLQIDQLATYFQHLGFNCYSKKAETSQSRQEYFNNNHFQNPFELDILLNVPYQTEIIQIQETGLSANQFYKLIKQNYIQWEKLTKFDIVLSRIDLVYERRQKLTDKISPKEFLNYSSIQFQDLHPYKNIASERNRKGLLLKIGNRKGRRHYRVSTGQKKNSLRFEAEIKGDLSKDFHNLLVASTFEQQDFEKQLWMII